MTLPLFGQSKAAYWVRWYKIYVTKVFCIYRKLFGNCSQRTVSLTLPVKNLNIQKWHVYYHGCQGRKLQQKNFIFTRRKIDEKEVLLMIALSYLLLMLVFQINSFSMVKEKLGVKERFIKTRQDSTIRKKVTRKNRQNSPVQGFISEILRVVGLLGEKFIFFQLLWDNQNFQEFQTFCVYSRSPSGKLSRAVWIILLLQIFEKL